MAETSSATTYTVLRVPAKPKRLNEILNKYREARLAALKADPGAFAVSYEDEIVHPESVWLRRLTGPSTRIFICLATPRIQDASYDNEDMILEYDWVGMATLNGPMPYTKYHLPESGQPIPESPERETFWHMLSLYTLQAYRGRGLAKLLIEATIVSAQEHTRGLEGGAGLKARIRLFCNPQKEAVVRLYKGMDFTDAGHCTLQEAFIMNGDPELIPNDVGDTKESRAIWQRRYGLAMERIVNA